MIPRLLWKEWQERRHWFLLWSLSLVALSMVGEGQYCTENYKEPTNWMMIPILLALLAGLQGYSSELTGNRAAFLYMRGVIWKQVLAVKILLGLGVAILTAVLTTAISVLAMPAVYHPFMTMKTAAFSALFVVLFTGGPYLLGLCCSVVLPGIFGSIGTLMLYYGGIMFIGMLIPKTLQITEPIFSFIGAVLGILAAMVVIVRFGLTLAWSQRLARFAAISLVGIGIGYITDFTIARVYPHAIAKPFSREVALSPSGRYALISETEDGQHHRYTFVVMKNDKRLPIEKADSSAPPSWTTNDDLVQSTYHGTYDNTLQLFRYVDGHLLQHQLNNSPIDAQCRLSPSPDGKLLLADVHNDLLVIDPPSGSVRTVANLDVHPHSTKRMRTTTYYAIHYWWQDNHTIGYEQTNPSRRIFVKVE